MEKVFEIYIKTTPERLWDALTDAETRTKFQFGNRVTSDWAPGSRWEMGNPAVPAPLGEGENLEVDPPRRLVQSFMALWGDDVKAEGTSRVTWEIEPMGEAVIKLRVTHDDFDGETASYKAMAGSWLWVLCNLKTFLETGEPMPS